MDRIMSTSIILLDQNSNANDVDIMVFEASLLFPRGRWGGGQKLPRPQIQTMLLAVWNERVVARKKKHPHFPITLAYRKCNECNYFEDCLYNCFDISGNKITNFFDIVQNSKNLSLYEQAKIV